MQAPLILPLRASPVLRAVLVLAHLLPVFAVWAAVLPRWASVIITLVVAVSALWHVREARLWHVCRIVLHESGRALLETPASAEGEELRILPESTDLGWLVVLVWQRESGGRVCRTAFCRDGLPADAWRTLRRWVRWQVQEPEVS